MKKIKNFLNILSKKDFWKQMCLPLILLGIIIIDGVIDIYNIIEGIITTVLFTSFIFLLNKFIFNFVGMWKRYVLLSLIFYLVITIPLRVIYIEKVACFFDRNNDTVIAEASTLDLASQIQYYFLSENISLVRNHNPFLIYYIHPCTVDINTYTVEIATRHSDDSNVKIRLFDKYKNKKKWTKKKIEKDLNKIVSKVDNVVSSDIYFENENDNSELIINYSVKDNLNYELENTSKIVEKLFENYENKKINRIIIEQKPDTLYNMYLRKMYCYLGCINCYGYENEDIIKLIEEAKRKLPPDYEKQQNLSELKNIILKLQKVDKKIKSYPHNYKYYIEKGDLLFSNAANLYKIFIPVSAYRCFPNVKSNFLWKEMHDNYLKAAKLKPNDYIIYEKIGDTAKDAPDIAINYYYAALKYNPNNKNILKKIADANYELEDYENAKIYYLKILKYFVNDDLTLYRLAQTYYYTNDYKNALKYYEKINKKSEYDAYSKIFDIYYISEQYDKARETALKCQKEPENNCNNAQKQASYNKIFELDLIIKNYKQAKEDAKNCSKIKCKIINKLQNFA